MTTTSPPAIHIDIDGTGYDRPAALAWELDRSRAALRLLKQRLGDDRVRELLAADTAATGAATADWLRLSGGRWRAAVTELTATGIDAGTFLAWWQGRLRAGDRAALLAANPEHYLADSTGGTVEIIETVGAGPLRFHLRFHPTPATPEYPVRIGGTGHLADGSEVLRVMHEFADSPRGLRIRLTVEFPAAAPVELSTGHQWHFACEFANWLEAAAAAS
ncbi:hypothetical protein SAMN05216371_4057 [Streptomyces sp. TLI_053]|uniref:hypothetical protein n=1 Tax=Streptomyces sp. TLI_053 TaxID=1855352 RepID=UPI00087BBA84|nr:hypothetical protein [Streptomyces sp. TLI_053]SDT71102.1 hypothetical protein SAMN05216371_4057 [Streptomyces sp. TLI_053]